jgi:hypothetical protein
MIEVKAEEFGDYYKRIGKVDAEIRKALRRRLTAAAKPVVQEVKQAALSIPSKGGEASTKRRKSGETAGLRASLALATQSYFYATAKGGGVKIRVSRSKFEAVSGRPNTIPYYVEGRRKRAWKHPVFEKTKGPISSGNAQNWITQKPSPFLGVTVVKHKDAYGREVVEAINDAIKECNIKLT